MFTYRKNKSFEPKFKYPQIYDHNFAWMKASFFKFIQASWYTPLLPNQL